jgi:hypothetical protein
MHAPLFSNLDPLSQVGLRSAAIPESDNAYPSVVLNERWRVIICRDGVQWVLQHRNAGAETVASDVWRGRSYCRTREGLVASCDRFCGPVDAAAAAALEALPWCIGATGALVPVTVPKVAKVPAKIWDAVARANSRSTGSAGRSSR